MQTLSADQQSGKVYTCVRLRPLPGGERQALQYQVDEGGTRLDVFRPADSSIGERQSERRSYEFSHIFDVEANQPELAAHFWPHIQSNIFNGFNATILCYGQTGAGKTYTLSDDGLIPRLCGNLFQHINSDREHKYEISMSLIEIYMDSVYDLIPPNATSVASGTVTAGTKRRDGTVVAPAQQGGMYTGVNKKNLWAGEKNQRVPVRSLDEVLRLFHNGNLYRKTASHSMNANSSRSHSLFYLYITQTGGPRGPTATNWNAKLTIVDLAGSERVSKTHSSGEVFKEGVAINTSLSALADVIKALAKKSVVIFRQNLLTLYLKDSLVNSFFALICCCSSSLRNLEETICTLGFGSMARKVEITRLRNVPHQAGAQPIVVQAPPDPNTVPLAEFDRLMEQVRAQEEEKERNAESLRMLENELAEKEKHLDELRVYIQQTQQELTQQRRRSADFERQAQTAAALQAQLRELENTVKAQENALRERETERGRVQQRLEQEEKQFRSAEGELQRQVQQLRGELQQLSRTQKLAAQELVELHEQQEAELLHLRKKHEEDKLVTMQLVQKKEAELKEKAGELRALVQEQDGLQVRLRELQAAAAESALLRDALAANERALELAEQEHAEEVARLEQALEEKERKLMERQAELDALRDEYAAVLGTAEQQRAKLTHELSELQAANRSLQATLSGLQREKTGIEQRMEALRGSVNESATEKEILRVRLQQKETELQVAQMEVQRRTEELSTQQLERNLRQRDLETLEEQLSRHTDTLRRVQSEKRTLEDDLRRGSVVLRQRQTELVTVERRQQEVDDRIGELQERLRADALELAQLRSKLAEKDNEVGELHASYGAQIGALKHRLALQEADLEAARAEFETRYTHLEEQQRTEKEELVRQVHDLHRQLEELDNARDADLGDRMAAVQQQAQALEREKAELERLVNIKEQERRGAQERNEAQLEQLRWEMQAKEQSIERLHRELYEREAELRDRTEDWSRQREELLEKHATSIIASRKLNTASSAGGNPAEGGTVRRESAMGRLQERLNLPEEEYRPNMEEPYEDGTEEEVILSPAPDGRLRLAPRVPAPATKDKALRGAMKDLTMTRQKLQATAAQKAALERKLLESRGDNAETHQKLKEVGKQYTTLLKAERQEAKSLAKMLNAAKMQRDKMERERDTYQATALAGTRKQQELKSAVQLSKKELDAMRQNVRQTTKQTEKLTTNLTRAQAEKERAAREKRQTEERLTHLAKINAQQSSRLRQELEQIKRENKQLAHQIVRTEREKRFTETLLSRHLYSATPNLRQSLAEACRREMQLQKQVHEQHDELQKLREMAGVSVPAAQITAGPITPETGGRRASLPKSVLCPSLPPSTPEPPSRVISMLRSPPLHASPNQGKLRTEMPSPPPAVRSVIAAHRSPKGPSPYANLFVTAVDPGLYVSPRFAPVATEIYSQMQLAAGDQEPVASPPSPAASSSSRSSNSSRSSSSGYQSVNLADD